MSTRSTIGCRSSIRRCRIRPQTVFRGLAFPGTGCGTRRADAHLYNDASGWGPRLGFAYQIAEKTVVRAGAGIFYGTNKAPGLNGANNGFTNSPSWSSAELGIKSAFQWDQGFPGLGSSRRSSTRVSTPDSVFRGAGGRNRQTWPPRTAGTSPSRACCRTSFVLDATYTGSKGTHLASDRVNIMQIDPKYAYLGALLNKPIDDPAVVALGFKSPFANFKTLLGGNATLGQVTARVPAVPGRDHRRHDESQRQLDIPRDDPQGHQAILGRPQLLATIRGPSC